MKKYFRLCMRKATIK